MYLFSNIAMSCKDKEHIHYYFNIDVSYKIKKICTTTLA